MLIEVIPNQHHSLEKLKHYITLRRVVSHVLSLKKQFAIAEVNFHPLMDCVTI